MNRSLQHPNRVLLGALALGICADYLFYGRWLGISVPLFVTLCLALLNGVGAVEDRRPTRANLWLGAAALFFAGCVALRDAPLLVTLNVLAVLGLLLLLVSHYRGAPLTLVPKGHVLRRSFQSFLAIGARPPSLVAQSVRDIPVTQAQVHRLAPVGRGLLLAVPVVVIFGTLLMAADYVFASYVRDILRLRLPFDLATSVNHLGIILAVTYVCLGGLQVALLDDAPVAVREKYTSDLPAEGDTQRLVLPRSSSQWLGCTEALTVLLAVDGLFGGFMLVQAAYFFGGMDTLDRTGMTYAEYARRGFFELLAATCLALVLLWSLALLTRRAQPRQRRAFNGSSAALIVFTLGLLASAFQRMLLYEQAYGYTRLRLYTHSFMIWLAVVLLIFLVALLRDRLQLFTTGSFLTALIYLALLNIANPDALIVRENIARYQVNGKLDAYYLSRLSTDATPPLVAALDGLDSQSRAVLDPFLGAQLAVLQGAEGGHGQGWPSWHLSRAQAVRSLSGVYGAGGRK